LLGDLVLRVGEEVNGRSYFSLNFTCFATLSGEMPRTTAPARSNSAYASRIPQA